MPRVCYNPCIMFVFACRKCRYTDLYEEHEVAYCKRCGGLMVSLGVSSAEWNELDTEQIYELIYDKVGNGSDASKEEELNDGSDEPAVRRAEDISGFVSEPRSQTGRYGAGKRNSTRIHIQRVPGKP